MTTHRAFSSSLVACIAAAVVSAAPAPVAACTRVLYVAKDGTVITGRSMDWGEDLKSNMWVLPAGMKRDGMGGKNTISWESKYGSLIVTGYDIGTCDGMNEKGLVVNMLALVESDYGKPAESAKIICMSTWAQYILDNHATVAEAVADFKKENFHVQTVILPDRQAREHAPVHRRPYRRLGGLRVRQGQARHPPRKAIQGDDQLAHLRQAVGHHGVLEAGRRADEIPPRHLQRRRSLRPGHFPAGGDPDRSQPEIHQWRRRSRSSTSRR